MAPQSHGPPEERVLVLTPAGQDAALACAALGDAGIVCERCAGAEAFRERMAAGAGVALLAEEILTHPLPAPLLEALRGQPPWSDLPVILFVRDSEAAGGVVELLDAAGNVTLLERPIRNPILVSAVRTALRTRRRQYEVRDLLCRLEAEARRKDEFLAMLGHELRNPLAAIRNALEVLQRAAPEARVYERQRAVMERQTDHLSRLVDDLLDVSRVTLGKITLQRERTDLRAVVQRSAQTQRVLAEVAGHRVTVTLPEEPVWVEGDPVRLEQVVTNLLNNAIKYTPPQGEIDVRVEIGDWSSEIGDRRSSSPHLQSPISDLPPSHAAIRVRDSGVGIASELLPDIFEPFTQAPTSIDRSRGGLGLGLSLVHRLVELHGGQVTADSEGPGRGSEFTVRLPLVCGMRNVECGIGDSDRSDIPHSAFRIPHTLRVLLVEDNADARETLRDLLELWGHEVEEAEDGTRGLARALAGHPDVVLVDIGLPGLDGYEVARQLRERANGGCPFLFAITGYGQPEDRRRALRAGFDAHLVKPVDARELERLLRHVPPRRAADASAGAGAAAEDATAGPR